MIIPIELFAIALGVIAMIVAIGFWRFHKEGSVVIVLAGVILFYMVMVTDSITMGFFIDEQGTADIYHYNVQSSTGQVLINAVTAQTQAEFASASNSQLVGDVIDCMTVWLGKAGIPPAGNLLTFGVFDINNNAIKVFGQMFPTDMPSSAITPYTMCLTNETWTIQNGHRIGVRYAAGDAANTITMRVDGNNPFD